MSLGCGAGRTGVTDDSIDTLFCINTLTSFLFTPFADLHT